MKAFRITLNRPLEREYLVFARSPAQARVLFKDWFYNDPATLADNSEDWSIKNISEDPLAPLVFSGPLPLTQDHYLAKFVF